eukprot:SAG11_NODE_3475_length_2425_cov_1.455718_2_plen_373_part_00
MVASGTSTPHAKAAILYSETADIWLGTAGTAAAAKRSLFIALRHAQLGVDVVIEEDLIAGNLNHYGALYIVDPQVSEAAMAAAGKWTTTGGQLVLTVGGGCLNETNGSSVAVTRLLPGFKPGGLWTGTRYTRTNSTIYFVKEQLPWAEHLDTVVEKAATAADDEPLGVYGQKWVFSSSQLSTSDGAVSVQATFGSDGSPAELVYIIGKGKVTLLGYHPGFSYFAPAIPRRPVDRCPHPDAFTNFIPTNFTPAVRAREMLAAPLAGVAGARPVVCDNPLVEASLIEAEQGAVITLVNWAENIATADAAPSLRVTVTLGVKLAGLKIAISKATLATCGILQMAECSPNASRLNASADFTSFSVDLAIADAIILR